MSRRHNDSANLTTLTFEEHDESQRGDYERVKQLRAQLAVVDRAMGLVGTMEHNDPEDVPAKRGDLKTATSLKPTDESFRIDLMSSQLATCPQCLMEMDVKKLKSHTASTCPNNIVTCPELNCGCQFPLRNMRRHLAMECEITIKRRKLVSDAEQRKQQEAQRLRDEAEQRRTDRERKILLENMPGRPASPGPATAATELPAFEMMEGDDAVGGLESRYTTCPKCNESMRQSQLAHHLDKLCSRRRVMCPNYHSGCKQGLVPLFLLQTHLRSECAAEKHRDKMIAKAAQRRELMKCPACGELVPLMYLRKHERELCGNRRVHCRNHALGCGVMVRMKDRALHEQVDGSKAIRSALYLPSHGTHLAVREDDLPCPWTAEYWIYRPPAKESLKMHMRNVALLLPKYSVAFAAEVCVKEQVMHVVRALNSSTAANDASAAADAGKLSKEQRAQRARELTAQRMEMVNTLTALVPQYTECVLAYTHAFQELAVSVEAAYMCALEVTSEVGFRDTEKVTLAINYPGSVAVRPTSQFSFVPDGTSKGDKDDKKKKGGKGSKGSKGSGSTSGASTDKEEGDDNDSDSDSVQSRSSAGSTGTGKNSKGSKRGSTEGRGLMNEADEDGFAEGEGDEEENYSDNENDKEFNDLLVSDYEEYLLEQQQQEQEEEEGEEEGGGSEEVKGGEKDEKEGEEGGDFLYDLGGEGSTGGGGGGVGSEENVVDGTASVASRATAKSGGGGSSVGGGDRGSKASRAVAAAITARRQKQQQQQRVNYATLATYLMNGSSLASVFKACLHLENEDVYYLAEHRVAEFAETAMVQESSDQLHQQEADGEDGIVTNRHRAVIRKGLLHPDLDLAYLLGSPSGKNDDDEEEEEEEQRGEGGDDDGHLKEMVRIPLESVSKSVLELKRQGVSGFLVDMVLAPRRAARAHALSWCSWRTLLEVLRGGLKTDFDALQDWRIEAGLLKPEAVKTGGGGRGAELTAKQEKAMEKKEKARLKREMKKQEMLHQQQQQSSAGEGSGADSPAHTATANSTSISSVVSGNKKEDNLFKRVGELLKAGSGTGILAESTSTSKEESVHTRLCLSLGSGLSILRPHLRGDSAESRPGTAATGGSGTRGGKEEEGDGGDGGDGGGGEEDTVGGDTTHFDDGGVDNHHYDLLLRPQELARLVRNSGKIGIVAIPQTVRDLTGMNDTQLQAYARELGGEVEEDRAVSNGGSSSKNNKSAKLTKRKKATSGAVSGPSSAAAAAVASKKAGSLVRLGMEARSFEVSVPRGKWTHIALVATALPQNKLTLYMDGLMVKSLKDCAFPLPMSALGGSTQSFESFEGALLDVRYWSVQRSSIEIVDNMHKLLDLDTDTLSQPPPTTTDSGAAAGNMSSTSSKGLVAWWTFEDGGGAVSATDVTGHRFKTLIRRRQNAASKIATTTKRPSTPSPAVAAADASGNIDDFPQRATTPAKNASVDTRATSAAAGDVRRAAEDSVVPAVEGVFTVEERRRYRIPEEVQRLLPVPYHSLLPAATPSFAEDRPPTRMSDSSPPKSRPVTAATAATAATATAATGASMPASPSRPATTTVTTAAVMSAAATPWGNWLAVLPRWSWLEAETLPTPKAIALPASLLSRPQLPAAGSRVNSKAKTGTTKSSTSSGSHHPLPPPASGGPTHPSSSSGASAASTGTKSVLPVPSLRARGICPYELRRHRLATAGRELQREVDCPLGCTEKVKMVDVRFHVRYMCQRRMVGCRFDFCHATFPIGQRSEHERSDCQQMFARQHILSQAELGMTLFPCTLCSENVPQRDMAAHQLSECPHRLVACRYLDCGLGRVPSIQAHLLQHHLRFDCDSPSRKERFMLVERARQRVNYPRPWGITVSLTAPADAVEEDDKVASSDLV